MLELLQSLPIADVIRRSTWIFPAIEVLHLAAIALLFGPILVADLTLLGAMRAPALNNAISSILAVTKFGIVLAASSGTLLFISDPLEFWNNAAFRLKLAAFALAIVNSLLFQRYFASQQGTVFMSLFGKFLLGASIVLWSSLLVLGRAIAYV
jgi:hypothetical protein